MKNVLTVLMIVLILAIISYAQTPVIDEALIITDGAGGTQTINFGLDATATDGIDATLGEAALTTITTSRCI